MPQEELARAAHAGLQDGAPRAGLVSLHARVKDVGPDSWAHPSLVQIWFRRAAYIVPRNDVAVFTLGCFPRDAERQKAFEEICDEVHEICSGEPIIAREVYARLHQPSHERAILVRAASVTGRLHIRWNASRIWIVPADRPRADPEDARLELARRFLHWFGPGEPARFEWWAGVSRTDARATWGSLLDELVPVDVAGRRGFILAKDEAALRGARMPKSVRLLPVDDPFTKLDRDVLVPDDAQQADMFPRFIPKHIRQPLIVNGEVAGIWHRQGRAVTVRVWGDLDTRTRVAVEHEAAALPIPPLSKPVQTQWA